MKKSVNRRGTSRVLALLLAVIMVLGTVPLTAITAFAVPSDSSSSGKSVYNEKIVSALAEAAGVSETEAVAMLDALSAANLIDGNGNFETGGATFKVGDEVLTYSELEEAAQEKVYLGLGSQSLTVDGETYTYEELNNMFLQKKAYDIISECENSDVVLTDEHIATLKAFSETFGADPVYLLQSCALQSASLALLASYTLNLTKAAGKNDTYTITADSHNASIVSAFRLDYKTEYVLSRVDGNDTAGYTVTFSADSAESIFSADNDDTPVVTVSYNVKDTAFGDTDLTGSGSIGGGAEKARVEINASIPAALTNDVTVDYEFLGEGFTALENPIAIKANDTSKDSFGQYRGAEINNLVFGINFYHTYNEKVTVNNRDYEGLLTYVVGDHALSTSGSDMDYVVYRYPYKGNLLFCTFPVYKTTNSSKVFLCCHLPLRGAGTGRRDNKYLRYENGRRLRRNNGSGVSGA